MPIRIDGSLGISNNDGDAVAPGLKGANNHVGIFFPSANTMAFSSSSTERMRVTSNGTFLVNATEASVNYTKAEIAGALRISGAVSPAPASMTSAVISYEYPYTRNYVGDGTGYSWAFSRRVSSTTTDLMTIADNGRVTSPLQPSFFAIGAGYGSKYFSNMSIGNYTNVVGGHNVGNHFSTGSSGGTCRFTAPVAGYYLFTAAVLYYRGSNTNPSTLGIRVNAGTVASNYRDGATQNQDLTISAIIYLAANDWVDAYAGSSTAGMFYDDAASAGNYGNSTYNHFSGRLLG